MSDAFVSYSRRDQEFVRRLHDALTERGKDVWMDQDDIPAAAKWLDELRGAIEAADAFVFVISPDSVASTFCRQEAEHAAALGKRIVPVLWRDVDDHLVPEGVASHNWINLREHDDFAAGFDRLVGALDTDLEWVTEHTRLITRATEWERAARDTAFTLRGRDLDQAERRLSTGAELTNPRPTPLIVEYVIASRRAAARGQRIRAGALATGLVVAVGLAGFAFVQLNEAVAQRGRAEVATGQAEANASEARQNADRANENARLATARELSAAADSQLTTDPELSVLLAREAVDRWADPITDRSLRKALETSRIRARYAGHESDGHTVDLTSDGSLLVSSSRADGTVRLWDTRTHEMVRLLRPAHGVPMAADISPDGALIVAGTSDGWIEAWNAATGAELYAYQAHDGPVVDLALSPDGRSLLSSGQDGRATLWDVATGKQIVSVPAEPLTVRVGSVAFAPDGRSFVTGSEDYRARAWDAQTGALLATFVGHTDIVQGVAMSADGRHIATAGQDKTARVWDAASGQQTAIMRGSDFGVDSVAFAPDGATLASAGWDGDVRIWDVATGEQLSVLAGDHGTLGDLAYDATGRSLTTTGIDGSIRTWALEPFEVLATYPDHQGAVVDGAFSPDGTRVATAGADTTATIHDTATGTLLVTLRGHLASILTVRFSPDGTRVVTASQDGTARIWDAQTGAPLLVLTSGRDPIWEAAWSPDGRRVATAGFDGTVRTWDAADGTPGVVINAGDTVLAVRYTTDGTRIVSGDGAGQVIEWDAESGVKLMGWPAKGSGVVSLAIDPVRPRIATLNREGGIAIWDQATGARQLGLTPAYGYGWSIAFSGDGTLLVTGGDDGAAHVWDAATGELFADIPADPQSVLGVAFAANGADLLLTSSGSARLVHCDLCGSASAVRALADDRVTRELSPAERVRWLHEAPGPGPTETTGTSPEPVGSPGPTSTPIASPGASVASPNVTSAPAPTLARGTICHGRDLCDIPAGITTSTLFQPALSFKLAAPATGLESLGAIAVAFGNGDDLSFLNAVAAAGFKGDSTVAVGASAEEWLVYLRTLPRLVLSPVEDLTVDGHPAKAVIATSDSAESFDIADADSVAFAWMPGQTMRVVIVDVNGGGLLIIGEHFPGTPAEDFDSIFDTIVSSIRFAEGPTATPGPSGT